MKIKILVSGREVPGLGITKAGNIEDVNDDLANSLIKQGMAEKYLNKIKPKTITDKTSDNKKVKKAGEDK